MENAFKSDSKNDDDGVKGIKSAIFEGVAVQVIVLVENESDDEIIVVDQ